MKLTRQSALALAIASIAMSAQAEVTFTPFATYHFFDRGTFEEYVGGGVQPDIEDADGYALALGYRFTPAFGLEVNYGRSESETDIAPSFDVRNNRLSLDGYYKFNAESKFSPFLLAGVGQTSLKTPGADTVDETLVEAGFGAFYHFNQNVALRAEVRDVHNVEGDLDDQLVMLGIEFSTGARAADEPAPQQNVVEEPAPAPVEEAPVEAAVVAPAAVVAAVPVDTDKDGVNDNLDKCPDTKAGAVVDADGCYQVLKQDVAVDLKVPFASGKATIAGDASAEIQRVASFMVKYPTVAVTIEGHTDSRGNAVKNKTLSQQRADAVKAEIVKLGVDGSRINTVGYGAERPIADNATEAGRAQNRRVVASAKAQSETIQMKQ